ncbi:hypothetical protein WJX72_008763 [[Myrmecia] bisecta]|uniref:Mitotic-spindle organizing protein 1 n=1 Tax=[Myrmecia] bisecta TaxID=41462 RepID=A0AAW1PB65_9CHLO
MDHAAVQQASEALEIVYEISNLLDTGLSKEELSILIALIENGVNPEALAAVVQEVRREAAVLQAARTDVNQQ